jgi:protein-disulfide isomerase
MKRNHLILLTVLALGSIFALAVAYLKSEEIASPAPIAHVRVPADQLIKPYNARIGNAQAKVTVVEYLDPECETCAALSPMVKGLINDYKDRVQFVVRYMLFHGNSQVAAQAIEAAGKQGKYWEMLAQLFYRKDWTHQEKPQHAFFETVAKELGLNVGQFKTDMQNPETLANIQKDYQEGPTLGVKGTPTFFVNGRLLPGISYEEIKGAIDEELAANP